MPWQSPLNSSGDSQEVNCPIGAREATLGCVGLWPPQNDRAFEIAKKGEPCGSPVRHIYFRFSGAMKSRVRDSTSVCSRV